MLNKVRIHQCFYLILSLFLIFITQRNIFFNITDINPSISILFLIIMSFGVAHGAADSIIIWKTFTKVRMKAIAFLIYLLIVFLGLLLWFQSPILGLIVLLLMSIMHFGQSDLSYLSRANRSMKISWGFVMTLLPVIFFQNDVKSIFDALLSSDIDPVVFSSLRILTIIFIGSFLFFVWTGKGITNEDKLFLTLEFLTTIIMASFLNPLYWFTIYFCLLHGLRALINIGIKSLRDFLFLIAFTLPVTFFPTLFFLRIYKLNILVLSSLY